MNIADEIRKINKQILSIEIRLPSAGGGGGGGAPDDAQYITLALDGDLTQERVLADGDGINVADGGAGGNVTISVDMLGIEDLADPGADRVVFWDDGAGATEWLRATEGVQINGTDLTLDINGLGEDAGAASGDFFVYYDVTDGIHYKIDYDDMPGGVSGPGASTDNAVARWNGAGGNTIQNSSSILTDADFLGLNCTPSIRLDVGGITNFAAADVIGAATGGGDVLLGGESTGSRKWLITRDAAPGTLELITVNALPIIFMTSGAEKMRLDSSGRLGVGDSTPVLLLDVNGLSDYDAASEEFGVHTDGGDITIGGLAAGARKWIGTRTNGGQFDILTTRSVPIVYWTNSTERGRWGTGGAFFIGDSSNSDMTIGLTINQAANSDEILTLKSSTVAHGFTAQTETDSFMTFVRKNNYGGAEITGYSEALMSNYTLGFSAKSGQTLTTHDINQEGMVTVYGIKYTGTGSSAAAANSGQNIFAVRTYSNAGAWTTLQLISEDGAWYNFGSASRIFLNENTNTNQNIGITINQLTYSTEAISFKKTGIAHGMTTITETDTYGYLKIQDSSYGGLSVAGFLESGASSSFALDLAGISRKSYTGKTSASYAPVMIHGLYSSGTGYSNAPADMNVFGVRTLDNGGSWSTLYLIDEDGDSWQKGGAIFSDTVYINDTSNADMTIGLTINQGSNDDEIFTFKSSDIAHGCTTYAETDSYGVFKKIDGNQGGVDFRGFSEYRYGFRMMAFVSSFGTAQGSTSVGAIDNMVYLISGTGVTNVTANGNLWTLRCQESGAGRTKAIFCQDGDLYLDTALNENAWDDFDDPVLCADLARVMSGRWREVEKYSAAKMRKIGILSPGGMFPVKRTSMLTFGAIHQIYEENQALRQQVRGLTDKIKRLGAPA